MSATADALPLLARSILDARATRLEPPRAATAALEILRQTAGGVRCQRLADTLGVSLRHLRRQVHDSAGVSPKTYGRVLRLTHAMRLADRTAVPAWADIAARVGCCDQSHLIREALALGGASPEQLHRERRLQRAGAVAERSNTA
jgi:transcriptional regulator GlxA family with amidase domain